jgi:hypothetical protein
MGETLEIGDYTVEIFVEYDDERGWARLNVTPPKALRISRQITPLA